MSPVKTAWRILWALVGLACMAALPVGCGPSAVEPTATPAPTATATPTPRLDVTFATRAAPTPAVAQLTPTPLPTATPLPTPTPIAYAVAAGDTVWSIAYTHGATPAELLALNPDVRPEALAIGQTLILPPPAAQPEVPGRPAAAPAELVVVALRLLETPVGSWWVLGEVRNVGDRPAENVQVEVFPTTAEGEALPAVRMWAATAVIAPGEQAPFGALVPAWPTPPQSASAVAGGTLVGDLGQRYLDFVVTVTAVRRDGLLLSLEGLVQNSGSQTAEGVALTVTLRDEQGLTVGYNRIVLPDQIAPQDRRPFVLQTVAPGGEPAAYHLTAQGVRAAVP